MTISVRFAGMGGQGIIFSGIALARAVSLYETREGKQLYAIQTQSYGPEARGGSSKCDVKISESENFYPFVDIPDYLVLMSQPAYDRFIGISHKDTVVVLDEDAVEGRPELRYYEIPATRKAEEMGKRIVANVVMLGAFVETSGIVSEKAVLMALADIAPKGTEALNRKAFELGSSLGKEAIEAYQ
jgi:2-oxoglutarate ferredoxin oxidoreductase subunit gamma